MITDSYPFQKNSVLSERFQLLKTNCHFSELKIQKVMVLMVTRVPFWFLVQ